MAVFFKREVMELLLANPEWNRKLEKAKSTKEMIKILLAFAKEQGFKVKYS